MKKNPLVFLSGIVVTLVLVAYLSGVFDREVSTIEVPSLSLTPGEITTLAVSSPSLTLTIQRSGEGPWFLQSPGPYPADSGLVGRFVRDLAGLEPETVISTNPDRYGRYGLDSTAKKLSITQKSGKTDLLYLGKNGPDYQSAYVRLNEDPRVFLARGRITLPTDAATWRDKTVFDLPTSRIIERVQVEGEARTFEVRKEGNRWQLTEDGTSVEADSSAVARWLRLYAPLKAVGFLPELTPDSVQASAGYQVRLTLTDQSLFKLWFMERDADLAVAYEAAPEVFKFNKYQKNTLLPDPATLRKK